MCFHLHLQSLRTAQRAEEAELWSVGCLLSRGSDVCKLPVRGRGIMAVARRGVLQRCRLPARPTHTHTHTTLPPSLSLCMHCHTTASPPCLAAVDAGTPRCWGWAPLGGVGSRWGGLLMPSQGTCCNPASTVFPFLSEYYPRVSVGRGFGVLKAMDVSRSLGLKISREAT